MSVQPTSRVLSNDELNKRINLIDTTTIDPFYRAGFGYELALHYSEKDDNKNAFKYLIKIHNLKYKNNQLKTGVFDLLGQIFYLKNDDSRGEICFKRAKKYAARTLDYDFIEQCVKKQLTFLEQLKKYQNRKLPKRMEEKKFIKILPR